MTYYRKGSDIMRYDITKRWKDVEAEDEENARVETHLIWCRDIEIKEVDKWRGMV